MTNIFIPESRYTAYKLRDFLNIAAPERKLLIDPILPEGGLSMIFSKRGVGKSTLALQLALSLSGGKKAILWETTNPTKVLYIDGEMDIRDVQKRIEILTSKNALTDAQMENLYYFNKLHTGEMCDIANEEDRAHIDMLISKINPKVVILDNLSMLCSFGESEEDKWMQIQEWLLSLRSKGIAVLMLHHAGKSGEQRGTSKREDMLDCVLRLEQAPRMKIDNGLERKIVVRFDKLRHDYSNAFDFEAEFKDGEWTWRCLNELNKDRIRIYAEAGMKAREIANELKLSFYLVSRELKNYTNE